MFRFHAETISVYGSLCTVKYIHAHSRSEYAAIALTTSVPTRKFEEDL